MKNNLLSKLRSDDQEEVKFNMAIIRPSPPSSQRPSKIMFDPVSLSTNTHQTKPPARITTTNMFEFEEPVTTQPARKTSIDPFESLFNNNNTKSKNRINVRDDTFTTTEYKSDSFNLPHDQTASSNSISTAIKPNPKQNPLPNDKLQRPKVVTNTSRPIPNWTTSEEIEDFVL